MGHDRMSRTNSRKDRR